MKTTKTVAGILVYAIAASSALQTYANTYYWIGGDSGDWASGANWSLTEGGGAANAYPDSITEDSAIISGPVSLTLTADATACDVTISGSVVLDGNGKAFTAQNINAGNETPMLQVKNVYIRSYGSGSTVYEGNVKCDLFVDEGDTAYLQSYGDSKNYYESLYVKGRLLGKGTFECRNNTKNTYTGVKISGDVSAFAGTLSFPAGINGNSNTDRNYSQLLDDGDGIVGSELARWDVHSSGGNNHNFIGASGLTAKFGALNGTPRQTSIQATLIEIGHLNEDCAFNGALNSTPVRKVGTGETQCGATKVGNLEIVAGTWVTTENTQTGNITFTGSGAVLRSTVATSNIDYAKRIVNSTATVIFDDGGIDRTWSSALPASNVGGFMKKGAGTLTLSAAPLHSGATTVAEGVLVVPGGTTLDELSVAEGAKFVVSAADGETIVIKAFADDTSTGSVVVPAGSSVVWLQDDQTGYWTGTISRSATTYTWTDATGDHSWNTPGNWTIGDETAMTPPYEIDTVVFKDGAEVVLPSNTRVASIVASGTVGLSGATIYLETVTTNLLPAKLTLGDSLVLHAVQAADSQLTIDTDLEILASDEHPAGIVGYEATISSGGSKINVFGAITGTGYLRVAGTRTTTTFYGRMTDFSGTIDQEDDSARAGGHRYLVYLNTPEQSSSNAVWKINNDDRNVDFVKEDGTYFFGALNGSPYELYRTCTFEIGARDVDSVIVGGNMRWETLRKVGTGMLSISNCGFKAAQINGGDFFIGSTSSLPSSSITFGGGALKTGFSTIEHKAELNDQEEIVAEAYTEYVPIDPSSKIVNSTAAIVFDDQGTNRTWSAALAESNTGGFTKMGAGTLTLSQKPLYKGLTTVVAGTLVVPADTDIVYNPLSAGTLEGVTPENFAYPAGTTLVADGTASDVAGLLDISNVTAIDASGAVLVKGRPSVIVSADSISGYTKESLALIDLTLPDGADGSKWTVKVIDVGGRRSLCVAPVVDPFRVIFR